MMLSKNLLLLPAVVALSLTSVVVAEEADEKAYIPETVKKVEGVQGWDQFLGTSFYGSMSQNSEVVGKDDGTSTTMGLKLDGAVDLTHMCQELSRCLMGGNVLRLGVGQRHQLVPYLIVVIQVEHRTVHVEQHAVNLVPGEVADFRADVGRDVMLHAAFEMRVLVHCYQS